MMRGSLPALVMAIIFVGSLAGIGAYDSYCLFADTPGITVSAVLREWSEAFPILPLLLGVVVGHLFFPLPRVN